MTKLFKLTGAGLLVVVTTLLLVLGNQTYAISAIRSDQSFITQPTLAPMLTTQIFLPIVMRNPQFSDEFDGNELNRDKWDIVEISPIVGNGKLTLNGGATRSQIQSTARFRYGVLQTAIESSNWKSQTQVTDSSFGFEIWTGTNGKCHHGVILVANGNLGVLRSQPNKSNECANDPKYQHYDYIDNWDLIRASGTIYLTLAWSLSGVTLLVSDGGSNSWQASYTDLSTETALPSVPLEIRFNADYGETYNIDYIRVY